MKSIIEDTTILIQGPLSIVSIGNKELVRSFVSDSKLTDDQRSDI